MPTNLTAFCDEMTGSVDVYRAVDAVYIYFSKPFDVASHIYIYIYICQMVELRTLHWISSIKKGPWTFSINDQWFEICTMATYEKHGPEDNTGIDTVQWSLLIWWKDTEHTLNKIRNNRRLGRGNTDGGWKFHPRGTSKRQKLHEVHE